MLQLCRSSLPALLTAESIDTAVDTAHRGQELNANTRQQRCNDANGGHLIQLSRILAQMQAASVAKSAGAVHRIQLLECQFNLMSCF